VVSVVKKDSTKKDSVSSFSPVQQKSEEELKKEKKELKKIEKEEQKEKKKSLKTESQTALVDKKTIEKNNKVPVSTNPQLDNDTAMDSVFMTADTLFSQLIFRKDYIARDFKLDREGGAIEEENEVDYGDPDSVSVDIDSTATLTLAADSLQKHIDSLKKKDIKQPTAENKVKKVQDTVTSKQQQKKQPLVVGDQNRLEIEKNLKADS